MKAMWILLLGFAAFGLNAQPTNGPPRLQHHAVEGKKAARPLDLMLVHKETRPNEVKLGKIELSGIVVEAATKPNPLQLVNPAAPPSYGSPEDNVMRDPISGHVSGLKLFSIKF